MDFSWRCSHWGLGTCRSVLRTSGTWTPCRELSAGLSVDELLGHCTPHTTSCLQMIHWGQQWTTSMWICIGNSPLVFTVIHMRFRFNFIVDILCELLINYLLTYLLTYLLNNIPSHNRLEDDTRVTQCDVISILWSVLKRPVWLVAMGSLHHSVPALGKLDHWLSFLTSWTTLWVLVCKCQWSTQPVTLRGRRMSCCCWVDLVAVTITNLWNSVSESVLTGEWFAFILWSASTSRALKSPSDVINQLSSWTQVLAIAFCTPRTSVLESCSNLFSW